MDATRRRLGFEVLLVGLFIAFGAVAWDLDSVASGGAVGMGAAHSLAATIVVILGVVLAVLGARMLLLERPNRVAYALFAASSLMFADGILHFYVVADHLAIAPYAVFFVLAGAVQIALGFGLFRERPLVYGFSALVTVGLIALFFAARGTTLPFGTGPEEWEASGVLSKVLEGATLGALVALIYWQRTAVRAGAPAAADEPKA